MVVSLVRDTHGRIRYDSREQEAAHTHTNSVRMKPNVHGVDGRARNGKRKAQEMDKYAQKR